MKDKACFWKGRGMKIYVCVKHVPDSAARITIKEKNRFDESLFFIMNPYDENAVEEALRTRERSGNSEVVAMTLGKDAAENTLRSALAMGADRGIFIKMVDPPDSIITARALKTAIEQDGKPDIIFTGKESIDSEGMQTMYRLASEFDIPVSTNVVELSLDKGRAIVEREIEAGAREILEMSLPCVIGAGKGLNTPRYIKFQDIMKARKKEIKQIDIDSLDFKRPSSSLEILEYKPVLEERQSKILNGQPEIVVKQLVELLKNEAKVFS